MTHLSLPQCSDLVELIESNKSLFADAPSQAHLLKHDIDVEDLPPSKQHLYNVIPDKRCSLKQQVSMRCSIILLSLVMVPEAPHVCLLTKLMVRLAFVQALGNDTRLLSSSPNGRLRGSCWGPDL